MSRHADPGPVHSTADRRGLPTLHQLYCIFIYNTTKSNNQTKPIKHFVANLEKYPVQQRYVNRAQLPASHDVIASMVPTADTQCVRDRRLKYH